MNVNYTIRLPPFDRLRANGTHLYLSSTLRQASFDRLRTNGVPWRETQADNKTEKERESREAFRTSKRKHSAVESGINALEVHGLDTCPDHGITGFKRYVALAIVARNIQKLGSELITEIRKQEKRRRDRDKLAA